MLHFCDCQDKLPTKNEKLNPEIFKSITEKIFSCKKCGAAYIVQEDPPSESKTHP